MNNDGVSKCNFYFPFSRDDFEASVFRFDVKSFFRVFVVLFNNGGSDQTCTVAINLDILHLDSDISTFEFSIRPKAIEDDFFK